MSNRGQEASKATGQSPPWPYFLNDPSLPTPGPPAYHAGMVNRGDILWLGIAAGVSGGLIGGMMLGVGMNLVVQGQPLGWLLLLPGAPASAIVGWIMARRLAKQL